jgi:hypothetical protein
LYRRLPRSPKTKKTTGQLSGGGSLSRLALNLDFYPFSLPAPEITRAPQVQSQHIRAFLCGLVIMNAA